VDLFDSIKMIESPKVCLHSLRQGQSLESQYGGLSVTILDPSGDTIQILKSIQLMKTLASGCDS
jgi:hypothetical protein